MYRHGQEKHRTDSGKNSAPTERVTRDARCPPVCHREAAKHAGRGAPSRLPEGRSRLWPTYRSTASRKVDGTHSEAGEKFPGLDHVHGSRTGQNRPTGRTNSQSATTSEAKGSEFPRDAQAWRPVVTSGEAPRVARLACGAAANPPIPSDRVHVPGYPQPLVTKGSCSPLDDPGCPNLVR